MRFSISYFFHESASPEYPIWTVSNGKWQIVNTFLIEDFFHLTLVANRKNLQSEKYKFFFEQSQICKFLRYASPQIANP
jgi:hypothetical protein